jgi:transposase-like protein
MKDRNATRRGTASTSQYSLMEFMRSVPDDAACLDWLWRTRYAPDGEHADCPMCAAPRRFRRYATAQQRKSWTCTTCGHHLHPTAGTIFEGSSTSLHLWFYAMYLMTSTRCGISAKQLEREIGVIYKTAWRMFHLIRDLMCEEVTDPSGTAEVDETYVGGKPRALHHASRSEQVRLAMAGKVTVQGMVERGGRVRVTANPASPLIGNVVQHVMPDALVYTDETTKYNRLFTDRGYIHRRVHHRSRV